jgi:hypothetical protein
MDSIKLELPYHYAIILMDTIWKLGGFPDGLRSHISEEMALFYLARAIQSKLDDSPYPSDEFDAKILKAREQIVLENQ